MVAIPQSGLLAQVSSLRFPLGHSGLVLTLSNAARASLPSPRLLVVDGCGHLHCFSAGRVTIGIVICWFYFFIFPPCYVALCASKARHRLGSESVSWCLETSLFLRLLSRARTAFPGQSSLPPSSVSFFVFHIFPTCF